MLLSIYTVPSSAPSYTYPAFLATTTRSSVYRRRDRAGLDTPVDLPRRTAHLAHLRDGARDLEVIRERSFLERAHFRHCSELSAEPPLATSNDLHNTMLRQANERTRTTRPAYRHRRMYQGIFN